jgi:proteasome accessory factor C
MLNQHKILRVLQLISLLKKEPSKSIKFLAGIVDSTDRTIYRYLDLIKELGFDLQRDSFNRYFIVSDSENLETEFTREEAHFLKELVLTAGKNNKLKDALLKKIYLKSEITIQGNHLLNAYLGKVVSDLSKAITEKKQVLLKKYQSANSNTISDRLVEPISFTDNYSSLCAFEIETGENKYFNIERMATVEVLETPMKHEAQHEFHKPDIFGFQGKSMNKEIELQMTLRAYLVFKEEYPMSAAFIKQIPDTGKYYFKANVQSYKAAGRFVMGFLEEVQVLGSKEFIRYIQRVVQKNT